MALVLIVKYPFLIILIRIRIFVGKNTEIIYCYHEYIQ